ncbi:toll-like receptor 8b [Aplochiton taeniatus]
MVFDKFIFSHLDQLRILHLDGNSLSRVPKGLPASLLSLGLSFNNIATVKVADFRDTPHIMDIQLYDSCCRFNRSVCDGPLYIGPKTFSNLINLVNLTLSANRLQAIPRHLPSSLRKLRLKLNVISHIRQSDLKHLVNLDLLDLSGNCPVCDNTPFPCVTCQNGSLQIHSEAFSYLSNLIELRLSGNSLKTVKRSWFEKLTGLQYLYLSFNSLKSEMASGDFLSVLPRVEVMDLSYNFDMSLSHRLRLSPNFSRLTSLRTLHLESYVFSSLCESDLEPLFSLTNLSVLNLGTNFLQTINLTLFSRFQNLLIVDLTENLLSFLSGPPLVCGPQYSSGSGPHHLGPFIHTDELYRHFPPSIKPECRAYGPVLDLSRNSIVTINPNTVQGLENTACLNLSNSAIQDIFRGKEFAHFPRLKYLDLSRNRIYLRSPQAFSELKELEVLDLSYNNHYFVVAGLDHSLAFLEHLGHLKSLNLSWNEINTLNNKTMLSSSLKELDFQGNRLDLMWNGETLDFNRLFLGLTNLTSLDISFNKLDHIPPNVYNFFPETLRHLSLSRNKLKDFNWNLLVKLRQLKELDLSRNKLEVVAGKLSDLTLSLRLLDLSYNRISVLEHGFLQGAVSLQALDLSFNLLTLLNQTTFESGVDNHLKRLSLQGNPLHCTCDLLDFQLWMRSNDVEFPLLATGVTCDLPAEIRGKSVLSYNIDACVTDDKAMGIFISTLLPVFLVLLVSLTAHLFYWDLHYMLEYCGAKLSHGFSQYTSHCYDAFVMYDTADPMVSNWVLHHLRVELEERGERACLLCLEERDWPPGTPVMENLSNSVHCSRKTVFVMTEGFLSSGLAKMAALLVQQRLVEEGMDTMVLLLLEPDVLRRSRILHLRRRLCRRSVLEWPRVSSPSAQRWFWYRLRRAIIKEVKATHTSLHSTYFTGQ